MSPKSFMRRGTGERGGRVVVMHARTYAVMQRTVEAILEDEASSVILYEMGMDAGRDSARTLLEDWEADLLKLWDVDRMDGMGWFKLEEMEIDGENGNGYIRVSRSFIAEAYGRSKKPICHFLSGFFVGVLGEVLGERLTGYEVKCIAKGDPYCEFRLERY